VTISATAEPGSVVPATGYGEIVHLGDWTSHVVRWSGRTERRVLLLHGFTAHAQSWQHLARSLAPASSVVALDQRGHGRSGPVRRHGSRPMVDDVERLLDHLGWEDADLVGQSMGGVNGFLAAAAFPGRVRRLIVIDIGPEPSAAGLARIRANAAGRPDTFASFDDAYAESRRSFPLADDELLRSRVDHNLVCAGGGRWTWRTASELRDGTALRDDHTAEEKWAAWGAVAAPTLLVRGSVSDVLTPDIVERMVAARPEVEVVTIEGASHSIPLDRPVELATVVKNYLTRG